MRYGKLYHLVVFITKKKNLHSYTYIHKGRVDFPQLHLGPEYHTMKTYLLLN
jgi:hypothetical protein